MGRPPIGKTAMTGAERTRLYRLKRGAAKPVTKPVTKTGGTGAAALQKELAGAKARIEELEKAGAVAAAKIAALKAELHETLGNRFVPGEHEPARPKADKSPLPPDEVRERRIKALTTQVRNLKQLLSVHEQHYAEAVTAAGGMLPETRRAIDKVLHPDSRATEADRNEACKGWNVWKNDNDKARRRRRA
jgi:hypothetical protein